MHSRWAMITETPLYSSSSAYHVPVLLMMLPQGIHHPDMLLFHSKPLAYLQQALVAWDFCPPVIPVVELSEIMIVTGVLLHHCIQQSGHPRMGKGGIANDRHRRINPGIRSSLGHGHRSPHIHTGVDGIIGRKGPQGITTNIGEYPSRPIGSSASSKGMVYINMTASLAKCGGPVLYDFRNLTASLHRYTQGFLNQVWRKFSVPGKRSIQTCP